LNHAYGLISVLELDDPTDDRVPFRLLVLRNPWGKGEYVGAWDKDSEEVKKYAKLIDQINEGLDEPIDMKSKNGTFLMSYEDWRDNFSTLFINVDFPEDWAGVRFQSKWTKDNSGGLPTKNEDEHFRRYAKNP
jgi:hypothetical protein